MRCFVRSSLKLKAYTASAWCKKIDAFHKHKLSFCSYDAVVIANSTALNLCPIVTQQYAPMTKMLT